MGQAEDRREVCAAAAPLPGGDRLGQDRFGVVDVACEQHRDPSCPGRRDPERIIVRHRRESEIGIGEHPRDTVTTPNGAREGRYGVRRRRLARLVEPGLFPPAVGACLVAIEREHDHRQGRQPGVLPHGAALLEPAEPAPDGLGPPGVERVLAQPCQQARSVIGIGARDRVLEGRLEQPLLLVPRRRSPQDGPGRVGFASGQLGAKQVGQEVVEPEPGAIVVERDQEEVGAFQPVEAPTRAGPVQDGVAERAADPFEHGGVEEEVGVLGRHAREDLGPQVVLDEPVARIHQRRRTTRRSGATTRGQGGEVDPGRPPFRLPMQGGDLVGGHGRSRRADDRVRLAEVERQGVPPDGGDLAARYEASHREVAGPAAGDAESRPGAEIAGERDEHVQGLALADPVDVVDAQGDRRRRREGRAEPGDRRRPDRRAGEGHAVDHGRVQADRAIEGSRDATQEGGRVVVTLVRREPGHGVAGPECPLRQQRGLAVAGWRDHHDDRFVDAVESLEQGVSDDDAAPREWWGQLRLEDRQTVTVDYGRATVRGTGRAVRHERHENWDPLRSPAGSPRHGRGGPVRPTSIAPRVTAAEIASGDARA